MHTERIAIVGAGIGGLAAAIELAASGLDVSVFERAAAPGGKLREVPLGAARLDAGPTVLTMRWVFDALFERAGARLDDALHLQAAGLLARHAWSRGERLDLHADIARSADAIGRFAGAAEARGYLDFCARSQRVYRALEQPFLRAGRTTPWGLFARTPCHDWPALASISPFTTLWRALGQHFRDPRLRQLFGRYATYCGSSPFDAPATLMLVAHVEQQGVWLVDGGMQRLADALTALARRLGVRLRCGAEVEAIEFAQGRATGLRLAGGERIEADAVLFNGDVAALAAGRLGEAARAAVAAAPAAQRSLSAITWHLVATARGLPLLRHTVFFSANYAAEFADLRAGRLPAAPTVYVCAQDRGADDGPPPDGLERLMCLVNAPARGAGRALADEEIARCETQTFQALARCGLRLSPGPQPTLRTTPSDFAHRFPATGGALYGPASQGWRSAFTRCGARSRIPGLYLAGGSTHPGPGVPMAALSGHLAAASLLQDLARRRASIATWPRAATPGGTSMP